MQQSISTNKLYITGSETEAHTVSIETITTVLTFLFSTYCKVKNPVLEQKPVIRLK